MTSQQQEETRRRIVVGVDGSEGSRTALRWAAEEAELHGTELHAVYAYQPPLELPVVSTPANPLIGSPEVKPEVYARRAEERWRRRSRRSSATAGRLGWRRGSSRARRPCWSRSRPTRTCSRSARAGTAGSPGC